MNATLPVFQPQRSNDARSLNAPASTGSQAAHANGQDFAGALNDAGAKPARKHATSRRHDPDSSGGQLPQPGNQPPPAATPPPPARTEAAPATTANSAVAASGTANASADILPKNRDAAPPAATEKPAALVPAPPPVTAAAAADSTQDSAGSQAVGIPGMPPGFSLSPTLGAAGPVATTDSNVFSGSTAGTPAPAAHVPAASANAAPPAKPLDPIASKASIAATTSAPTSTDANAAAQNGTALNTVPSSAQSDAAAQALMAAAIAQGASAPATQPSPPADDLATPDAGPAPQGFLGSSAAQTSAIAAAATHSSASLTAAVRAATALTMAQAVSASADAGAADKHSRGGLDSLSGTSNDGTAGAAQLLTSSPLTDVSPPPTLKVAAGVDTAEFGQGVADRVSLMMDSNLTSAKLQVNPPALGPIEVRIALQGGHAQVWFTSHSAVTRDALESSSPQLREMLGAQGFGQVSVDISQRSFQERSPQSHGYQGASAISGESSASVQTPGAASRAASGLLDAYA